MSREEKSGLLHLWVRFFVLEVTFSGDQAFCTNKYLEAVQELHEMQWRLEEAENAKFILADLQSERLQELYEELEVTQIQLEEAQARA